MFVYKAEVPGAPSTQHEGDAVSCQDPGQTGEVGMAIWTLFKHTLVQLSLTHKTHRQTEMKRLLTGPELPIKDSVGWRLVPASANSSWRTLCGGRTGDGVWRSSSACSATRPSLWAAGRPPCAATPAASAHGLHCPPTSAPTTGGEEEGEADSFPSEWRFTNTVMMWLKLK